MAAVRTGVAFVGAGIVAEMHGRAVTENENAEFIGVYDPQGDRCSAVAARFSGRPFRSLEELLAHPRVDAVHILTPTQDHVPTALRCLGARKHVLVEKPVAHTHAEIDDLKSAAAHAGRVCMPAHNYIYVPALRRARQLIETGKLGQISSLWVIYNIFHPEDVAALYGGVLRAVCIHHAYSLLYLLGRPTRLVGLATRVQYKSLHCEEQAIISCEMSNGAIANLWCSFAANDPTSDPWTVVYKLLGTNGGVNYSWNESQFRDDGGPAWGMPCYGDSFAAEIDYFLEQCILRNRAPLSSLDDASDALSIVEAAEACIRDGGVARAIHYRDHSQKCEEPFHA